MERYFDNLLNANYPINWHFINADEEFTNIFEYANDFKVLTETNLKLDIPFSHLNLIYLHTHYLMHNTNLEEKKNVLKYIFQTFKSEDTFQSIKELRDGYVEFLKTMKLAVDYDKNKLQELVLASNDLMKVNPIISYGKRKIASAFTYKIPVDTEQNILPDFFAALVTSYFCPFVKYTDESGRSIFKIYKGDSDDLVPSYKVAIPNKLVEKNNCIFMYIWKMPDSDKKYRSYRNVQEARIEDFILVTLEQIKSDVVITCDNTNNQKLIITRIQESFPTINLGDTGTVTETGLTVEVFFYMEIQGGILLLETIHMQIMLIPFLNNFFYLDESSRGRSVAIQQKYFSGKGYLQDAEFPIGKQLMHNLSTNENSVVLKASIEADNTGDIEHYIQNMKYVLGYISQTYSEYQNYLISFVPDLFKKRESILIPILNNGEYTAEQDKYFQEIYGISKVKLLQSVGGDLFKGNYSRSCQRERQPVPVSNQEAQIWVRKEIKNNKTLIQQNHEVVQYPEPSDLMNPSDIVNYQPHLYVCPSDESPFVIRKPIASKTASHLHIKNILCCATSIVSDDAKISETVLQTYKIAKPGQLGIVNIFLEDNLFRQGTFQSNNSILHCLNFVTLPNYHDMNFIDAENITKSQRTKIIDYRYVMKQELYDKTYQQLENTLSSDEFLDPFYWIRGLEEMFNLNIFVFHKKYLQRGGKTISKLMIPRNKFFHIPNFDETRKTVIILKHFGAEINNLDSPQCELVIRNSSTSALFEPNDPLVTKLRESMDYISGVISWDTKDNELIARKGYFTSIRPFLFKTIGPFNITGQFIDSNGKLRMFIVNNKWSIVIPPSAPLNVPVIRKLIKAPTQSEVFEAFGVGKYASHGDRAGYWYDSGDTPNSIFILSEKSDELNELKEDELKEDEDELKDNNPVENLDIPSFLVEKDYSVERARELKRTAQILMQLLCYVYLTAKSRNASEFLSEFTVIKEVNYNISRIPRILPKMSFSNLMDWLSSVSNIVEDNKILISSEKFYSALFNQLQKLSARTDIENYRVLRGYYSQLSDYSKQQSLEYILMGVEEFSNWENFVSKKDSYITEIKDILSTREPILFKQLDKFYLLQNVSSKTIEQALGVAKIWHESKINPGFFNKQYFDAKSISYGEYETDQNGHLVFVSKEGNQDDYKINILNLERTSVALLRLH